MNIDINRDVVVGFDGDGRPVNSQGELVSWKPGTRRLMSKELLESWRRARKEIKDE